MTSFRPIKTEKFAQEVANSIKESIFDGTYESGDKLPSESELAKLFGVSKVSIRQAIRVLENSGIVYTKQGVDGGIFVSEADSVAVSSYLSDMLKLKRVSQSDLTFTRMIFEPDIASLVANVWEGDDLEAARVNIHEAQIALDRGDVGGARLLNLAFHRLFCAITRNPVIIFTLNSVIDVLEENVLNIKLDKEFVEKELEEHIVLLGMIERREADQACKEMRKHITKIHEKLEELHRAKSEQNPKKYKEKRMAS